MNSYFCIVNAPGISALEICVLKAKTDAEAQIAVADVAAKWIGFDTIYLYQGERLIQVLSNSALGFPQSELLSKPDEALLGIAA